MIGAKVFFETFQGQIREIKVFLLNVFLIAFR